MVNKDRKHQRSDTKVCEAYIKIAGMTDAMRKSKQLAERIMYEQYIRFQWRLVERLQGLEPGVLYE